MFYNRGINLPNFGSGNIKYHTELATIQNLDRNSWICGLFELKKNLFCPLGYKMYFSLRKKF